ncbi:DUF3592 domain-containing protein [Nocardia jiangsuensis]|uniref:DUF3592 domain-containing protein n=1 Tax=Nocardia jiangsuensis TaxID=1691563 RepID=A0ABV8DVH2_9NOCA
MQGNWEPVGAALVFGLGGLLILGGFYNVWVTVERIMLLTLGFWARGVIVSVRDSKDSDDKPEYYPTVEFVTRTGEPRRAEVVDAIDTDGPGHRIVVLYRPGNNDHVAALDP